jgi:putative zinc finger/helix-turn-helix YgiT family protein
MPEKITRILRDPKPYPHRCAACGKIAVEPRTISYDAKVKHDGKVHEFHISELSIEECSECGEQYFNTPADEQISAGLRSHLGLLQPEEIRRHLSVLELTQYQFAAHLRVAPESVSRWLTGSAIQSRSLDTLMRVYFRFPDVRQMLQKSGSLSESIQEAEFVGAVANSGLVEVTLLDLVEGRAFIPDAGHHR